MMTAKKRDLLDQLGNHFPDLSPKVLNRMFTKLTLAELQVIVTSLDTTYPQKETSESCPNT